jgi:hypothetical protein
VRQCLAGDVTQCLEHPSLRLLIERSVVGVRERRRYCGAALGAPVRVLHEIDDNAVTGPLLELRTVAVIDKRDLAQAPGERRRFIAQAMIRLTNSGKGIPAACREPRYPEFDVMSGFGFTSSTNSSPRSFIRKSTRA